MQNKEKFVSFTLRHVEPIKIRKVRISSRKSKKDLHANEKGSSSEHGNSTAVSQKSLSRISSTANTGRADLYKFYSDSLLSSQEFFDGIQEINENSEYDDDSVIMQLNELLSDKSSKNEKKTSRIEHPRPPMAGFKIKINEKINPVVSARKYTRTKSYKNIQ